MTHNHNHNPAHTLSPAHPHLPDHPPALSPRTAGQCPSASTPLPGWLTPGRPGSVPAPLRPRWNWRRAAGVFTGLLHDLLSLNTSEESPGFLQAFDPRAKISGLLFLLILATFLHHLWPLLLLTTAAVILALASRISPDRLFRLWFTVPLCSAAIILPALLNWITPGQSLLVLGKVTWITRLFPELPEPLAVTDTGLYLAARFVLRSTACVTLALLLAATSRPERLFRALRQFGLPTLFVLLLSMMQRYLTLLARVAGEIHLAKISRTLRTGRLRDEQAWVAAGVGALFRRTLTLGETVSAAMLSRGFTGELHLLRTEHWRQRDGIFCLGVVLAGGLLLGLDRW